MVDLDKFIDDFKEKVNSPTNLSREDILDMLNPDYNYIHFIYNDWYTDEFR